MIFEIEVVLNSKQCLLFCYSLILIRLHGAWSAKVEGFEWALCSWGHMTTISLKIFYIMGYNLKNARNGKSISKIPKWLSLRSLALKSEIL